MSACLNIGLVRLFHDLRNKLVMIFTADFGIGTRTIFFQIRLRFNAPSSVLSMKNKNLAQASGKVDIPLPSYRGLHWLSPSSYLGVCCLMSESLMIELEEISILNCRRSHWVL